MKITKILRRLWHDAYYVIFSGIFFSSRRAIEFALHCENVAATIDLGDEQLHGQRAFRYYLHLSVCQVCKNYLELRDVLRSSAREAAQGESSQTVARLNDELLRKFTSVEL